jgi:hypothetical protein
MIRVSDTATLDGTLSLRFVNGYVPAGGEEFLIVDAGRIVGDFATVGAEGITGQRFTHRIDHTSGDWYFVIVPEPAALATMLVSSALLFCRRRPSRRALS